MNSKTFYGVSGGVFVVTFATTLVLIEVLKPEWAIYIKDKMYYEDIKDAKQVDHVFAVVYSLLMGLLVSSFYALVANMWLGEGKKLPLYAHGTLVMVAVFLLIKLILFFTKPEFLQTSEKELDMTKSSMFALSIAIIAGIVDFVIYKKSLKTTFELPSASRFSESDTKMEYGGAKQHYKMSFPMRSSCGM